MPKDYRIVWKFYRIFNTCKFNYLNQLLPKTIINSADNREQTVTFSYYCLSKAPKNNTSPKIRISIDSTEDKDFSISG
jgi:hypothetical protein